MVKIATPTKSPTHSSPGLTPRFDKALRDHKESGDIVATEPWARGLFQDALDVRASDIHVDTQDDSVRLRFRIDGALHDAAELPLNRGLRLLRYLKVHCDMDPAPSLTPEDGHIHMDLGERTLDVRIACVPCVPGDKLTMRLHSRAPVSLRLADLGLRETDRELISRWLDDISGMFVVGGPVGSGKTTTLYALLAELDLAERNVVTIEDPVEYQLERINQIEVDHKTSLGFPECLRSILRHDPDYVLLGEIRDRETADSAMKAASTGRVLLTTMHTRSAAGAVTALRSMGIENYEIAASLAFVVTQRLVRRLCENCREQARPTEFEARWLDLMEQPLPEQTWQAKGCEKCHGTGYYSRTGLFEVSPIRESVYDLIIGGAGEHQIRAKIQETSEHTLLSDGLEKASRGLTDLRELTRIGARSFLLERK